MAVAWVLNLDADLELGRREAYTPSAVVLRVMRPHVETLRASLTEPNDVLVDAGSPPGSAEGLVGRAFCPTPRAIALLRRAGAMPERHPSFDVLARVNSRAFASALGQTLPGAAFVTDMAAAGRVLAARPPVGVRWRVKHAFGMTGRNQRVAAFPPDEADRDFVRRGVVSGVQIEPDVRVVTEYAMHGFLRESGELLAGRLVAQRCDARGQWLTTQLAPEAPADVHETLKRELVAVAAALRSAGFFGPFGIDAFTYRGKDEAIALHPRSEINARYSMGFSTGFGAPPAPPR